MLGAAARDRCRRRTVAGGRRTTAGDRGACHGESRTVVHGRCRHRSPAPMASGSGEAHLLGSQGSIPMGLVAASDAGPDNTSSDETRRRRILPTRRSAAGPAIRMVPFRKGRSLLRVNAATSSRASTERPHARTAPCGARDQLAARQPLQWRSSISRGMMCLDYYRMGDIRFPRLCLFILVPGRRSRLIRPRPWGRSVRS